MDLAPSSIGRSLSAPRDLGWDSARDRSQSWRRGWTCNPRIRQRRPDDSVARTSGAARADSVFWNQPADSDRGSFPLRLAADRAEHGDRLAGHRKTDSRIGRRAWPRAGGAPVANLSADGV